MVSPVSDLSDTPFGAPPRPLTEDVLQSAEEAVLAKPVAAETPEGVEPASGADGPARSGGTNTNRLGRIVGERPIQSALVALAAGALVASLVKLALARRRR